MSKDSIVPFSIFLAVILSMQMAVGQQMNVLNWEELPELPPVSGQSNNYGVAGAFSGIHNGALIVAGGANFPEPRWESNKEWHSDIWVLPLGEENNGWMNAGNLNHPVAYGSSVMTEYGLLCMGGNSRDSVYREVFLLQWNPEEKRIARIDLPSLPEPCAYGDAAYFEDKVYLAGGSSGHDPATAMKNFWMLDISDLTGSGLDTEWKELPPWPGPPRVHNITTTQHNGQDQCIYVVSGRRMRNGNLHFMKDLYEFNPRKYFAGTEENYWKKKKEAPVPLNAAPAAPIGQSHIFMFGGATGELFDKADSLKDDHPGFPQNIWSYHTITNSWVKAGESPVNMVTTNAMKWNESVIIPGGEIRPRTRTPENYRIEIEKEEPRFGAINFVTLGIYLLAMLLIGVYFSFRNKNTNDYFRGGQNVPWWAAGLSIFATMLSALTFMSIPAKAYTTDWTFFIINMCIILVAPFVIYYILPFFRKIDATSAYEYLEKRFNLGTRLFASLVFIFFHIGRMAIVMFLPALALSTIIHLSIEGCILLMGVLSIIYCTLGGLRAVIWTDAVQSVILLGGAFLSIVLIFASIDGGLTEFFTTAAAHDKLQMIHWDWKLSGITGTTAFWVVLLGGLGQQIVPYSADQAVIQRYMSVSNIRRSRKSIWTNAVITFPASILFFGVGTALFVFYSHFPAKLDPTYQNDAIFALFIARELPVGISGLVVAGIFAAAQSTISTSMNSVSTIAVTDFFRRFSLLKTEKSYFRLAWGITFTAGVLGTFFALLMANADIKSLWDSFMRVLGIFGGVLCGLFFLGIFTKRANGKGAFIGAIIGVGIVVAIRYTSDITFVLYALIGIVVSFIVGYMASLFFKQDKDIIAHTIYSRKYRE
ncbi:MAG: sodium:solute symporter family transporter [Bacteroidota bacterium]